MNDKHSHYFHYSPLCRFNEIFAVLFSICAFLLKLSNLSLMYWFEMSVTYLTLYFRRECLYFIHV